MAILVPIKVHCGCGQRYAFDVEPIGGRLPSAVSCPSCGTDGTTAANQVLAHHFQSQPAPAMNATPRVVTVGAPAPQMQMAGAAPSPRMGIASAVPASPVAATAAPQVSMPVGKKRLPGQMDPDQASKEARAKILWGDEPGDVKKFLMAQGFTADEANNTVEPLLIERKDSVRAAGKVRIFKGIGMMCVPVVAFFLFMALPIFPLKLFGAAVAIGAWGAFKVLSGIITFLSPKSEKGDVSDM